MIFFFTEDTVVHEFSALGLSNMATEFSSKATIFEGGGVEALVKCLNSSDPDVQKNSVEALAQLLLVRKDYHLAILFHTVMIFVIQANLHKLYVKMNIHNLYNIIKIFDLVFFFRIINLELPFVMQMG